MNNTYVLPGFKTGVSIAVIIFLLVGAVFFNISVTKADESAPADTSESQTLINLDTPSEAPTASVEGESNLAAEVAQPVVAPEPTVAPEEVVASEPETSLVEEVVESPDSLAPPTESPTDIQVDEPTESLGDTPDQSAPETEVVETQTEDFAPVVELTNESVLSTTPLASVLSPTLTTDKEDYHPGETATIFGKFFGALQNIVLKIFGVDENNNSYTEEVQNLTADAEGSFSTSYTLDGIYRPLYNVVANAVDGTQLAQTTFTDSRTVNPAPSTTLDGSSSVSVAASASISAVVSVTGGGSGTDNWESTAWRINTTAGTPLTGWTCVNTPDHLSGTNTETISITAPSSAGTYNAYFIAYDNDNCTSGASATLTMSEAVIVVSPGTLPFSESFGTTATDITGWYEPAPVNANDTEIRAASSGNDSASPNGSAFGLANGNGGWFCKQINATGFYGLKLSYYWRGDDSSSVNSSDDGIVEYKTSGSCSDSSGWSQLQNHDLQIDSSWTTQSAFALPGALDNSSFLLKFRAASNDTSDDFRVDGISITGGLNQTITVNTHAPASAVYGSTFPVAATASSGLTVAITTTGGCSIAGGTVTMTSASVSCVVHYNQAGNATYNAAPEVTETATASKKNITAIVTANNKGYDGNDSATIATCGFAGGSLVGSDVVTCSAAGPNTFDNKNFGTAKTVTATNISLGGANAGNYQLNSTSATANADIAKRAITVTATTNSKPFDGNTSAAATPTITSGTLASGDSASFTETYDTSAVGTGKTLTPAGSVTDGNGGANYTVTFANNLTGVITSATTATSITNGAELATNSVVGQPYTVKWSVTSAGGTPTGTVTVSGGSECSASVAAGECSLISTEAGVKSLVATYEGDGSFDGSASAGTPHTVGKATLTVTAYPQSKTYGAPDPTFTFVTTGFVDDVDPVDTQPTCTVAVPHADVGSYPITCSGGADDNYDFSYVGSTLTVNAKAITVTAGSGQTKVYGASDPTYTYASDPLESGDLFTGELSRVVGENVGSYAITQGSLDAGANYAITFVPKDFSITAKPITVTAEAKTKVYGDPDPVLTYVSSDLGAPFTGSLSRVSGESIGLYAINQNDLSAGSNYTITYVGADLEITKKSASVTPNAASKVYGDADPAFSGTLSGFLPADGVSATYSRIAGETVVGSPYTISATLSPIGVLDNYEITYNTADFAITKAPSTTVVTCSASEVYTGSAIEPCSVSVTGANLSLTPAPVYADNINVGTASASYTFAGDDNHTGSSYSKNFEITKKTLTITAIGVNKVYDGDNTATVTLSDDRVSGDVFIDSYAAAIFTDKNIGTSKGISVSGISISGADAGNYSFNDTASTNADITVRPVTVTAQTNTKVYDGNTSAAAIGLITSGSIASGDTAPTWVETYDNKNVGTDKTLTASGVVSDGNGGLNYSITFVDDTTGVISAPAALTVTGITASNKVYDNGIGATLNVAGATLVGVVPGDSVTLETGSAVGTFNDKNVANNIPIEIVGLSLSGGDAGNYTLTQPSTSANITPLALNVTATADDKTYDGNTNEPVFTTSVTGLGSDDVSTAGGSAVFDSANAGPRTVTVSGYSLAGANNGNYSILNSEATAPATINKANAVINVSGYTGTYDGAAHGVSGTATGVEFPTPADLTSLLHLGDTFTDVPGGTADWTFDGNENYNTGNGSVGVVINKATANITVNSYSVPFDGNEHIASGSATGVGAADLSASLDLEGTKHTAAGVYNGDAWSFAGGTNYNDANGTVDDAIGKINALCNIGGYHEIYDALSHGATGTCKGVGGVDLPGLDLGASFTDVPGGTANWTFAGGTNYNDQSGSVPIEIVALNLTGQFTAGNKTYDGNTSATVLTRSLTGVLSPDGVTLDGGTATFDTANAGTGKTVTLTGATLGGADAGNYNLDSVDTTTANIEKANAAIVVHGYSGTYDGSAHGATGTATGVELVAEDLSSLLHLGSPFTDVPGGNAHWTFDGNDNYNSASGDAAIELVAMNLHASATADNKTYDGNTDAVAHLTTDALPEDTVVAHYVSAAFDDKNAGTDKNVAVAGISIDGDDAGNYDLLNTTANASADIAPKSINVTADAGQQKYVSEADPAFTYTNDPLISPDVLTGALGRVAGETAGTYAINQGTLSAGSNYTINFVSNDFTIVNFLITAQTAVTPTTDSITITWTTDHNATSRVVYGTAHVSDADSALAGGPNYGYPSSTGETDTPASTSGVLLHSVTVTGLTPGTPYFFRAVSHGSPETVSQEIPASTLQATGGLKVTKTAVGGDGTFGFTGSAGISPFNIGTVLGAGSNTISGLVAGSYTLNETPQVGWYMNADLSTCDDGVNVVAGQTTDCTVVNQKQGNIIVKKITVGGTGSFDFTSDYGALGFSLAGGAQNDSGFLNPDTYAVSEAEVEGWTLTSATCSDGSEPSAIVLDPGETVICTFTNTKQIDTNKGKISGVKFEDKNGNGIQNVGDNGLPGWVIYLDTNNNGKRDRGERWTVTNRKGEYSFGHLAKGTYNVREILKKGWMQTAPVGGKHTVVLAVGQVVGGKNFGNFKLGTISGTKFYDKNRNGKMDDWAKGLGGWTIKLKLPNGTYKTTVTDKNGNYSFKDLGPGTYVVTEVQQPGWTQITANPAPILISSGKDAKKVSFGNAKIGSIFSNRWDRDHRDDRD